MKDYRQYCVEEFMLSNRKTDFPTFERQNKQRLIQGYMDYLQELRRQEAYTRQRAYLAQEAQIARQKNALLDEQASRRATA